MTVRVAFTLIGGGKGTGVYNYLLNLIRLLLIYEESRITPVLFLGLDTSIEDALPFENIPNLQIVRSPFFDKKRRNLSFLTGLFWGVDVPLRTALVAERINVIFESAQFFGWRLGIPVIAWIPDFQHRHLPHMFSKFGYWKREFGFQAQIAAGRTIMLSSEDAKNDCENFYPNAKGRTRAIHFSVYSDSLPSLEVSRAVADKYGLPEHYLFLPNQFTKHKNHTLVLTAVNILKSQGHHVVVVSSGKQADERDPGYFLEFKAKLEQLDLSQQFRLLGLIPYSDLIALMLSSACLINPSLFEGWSTTVEEAKSMGVPMLLSDLNVNHEQAGKQARYFERHNAIELAEAILSTPPFKKTEREKTLFFAQQSAKEKPKEFSLNFAHLVLDVVINSKKIT